MDKRLNHPLYFYAIQKRNEGCKRLVYHYTNVDSFFSIINSMSLKVSLFNKSDDLNEANIANVDRISDIRTRISLEKYIKDRCSYLSFVQDGKIGLSELEGTNHPRMWSQYAQRGLGACFAIDEERFLKINSEKLNGKFYKFETVQYEYKNGPSITIVEEFVNGIDEKIIKQNYQELFFKKHIDWREENEKRLFGIDIPEYLSIYGALEYICLGPEFIKNEGIMINLIDYLTNSCSKFYGYLVPHSFAYITPYDYGYFSHDAMVASEILRKLEKREKYKQYLDEWCSNQEIP